MNSSWGLNIFVTDRSTPLGMLGVLTLHLALLLSPISASSPASSISLKTETNPVGFVTESAVGLW